MFNKENFYKKEIYGNFKICPEYELIQDLNSLYSKTSNKNNFLIILRPDFAETIKNKIIKSNSIINMFMGIPVNISNFINEPYRIIAKFTGKG